MAGGEVTPDGLIVIGQIAKEYGLYTKLTGGQRVDMFGAQVHQLPEIWEKLINAGFESGHAYGKSLRTVKSCVGSTWCRYGVDDSVGLAIFLETVTRAYVHHIKPKWRFQDVPVNVLKHRARMWGSLPLKKAGIYMYAVMEG